MLSIFDVFSIGIGPSSSHTVGPMRAGKEFSDTILERYIHRVARIQVDIFGSLALTGAGHGTMSAILSGLEGNSPETVDTIHLHQRFEALKDNADILIGGLHALPFCYATDMLIHREEVLPLHSNGMILSVFDTEGELIFDETYYSIGGGTIRTAKNFSVTPPAPAEPPHVFTSWQELALIATENAMSIAQVIMANELAWRTEDEICSQLDAFYTMGLSTGALPKGTLAETLASNVGHLTFYGKLPLNKLPALDSFCLGPCSTPLPYQKKMPRVDALLPPRPTAPQVLSPLFCSITKILCQM